MKQKIKQFIYSFTIFDSVLFFCIFSILGINYSSDATHNLTYTYCAGACAVLSMFYLTKDIICDNHKNIRNLLSIFIFIVLTLAAIISDKANTTMFKCSIVLCLPATMIGIYSAKQHNIDWLTRWLDIWMIIITISLIPSLRLLFSSISLGTSYYSQTISYYASFAFSINLFLIGYGKTIKLRLQIFNTQLYKYIQTLLIPFQIASVFFSGGRGGFIVIVVSVLIYLLLQKITITKIFKYFGIILLFLLVIPIIRKSIGINLLDILEHSTSRIFSYITSSGIDMSETSGRDDIYKKSILLFYEKPFWGYGVFSYPEVLGEPYPHNVILEWLLQGGVILCVFGISLMYQCFKILLSLLKINNMYCIIIPIIIFQFTELLFSGSYMQEPLFWFIISFLFNINHVRTL